MEKEGVQRVFLGEKGSTGVQFENMPFSVLVKGPRPGDQMYHEESLVLGPSYKSRAHQLLKNCMFWVFVRVRCFFFSRILHAK